MGKPTKPISKVSNNHCKFLANNNCRFSLQQSSAQCLEVQLTVNTTAHNVQNQSCSVLLGQSVLCFAVKDLKPLKVASAGCVTNTVNGATKQRRLLVTVRISAQIIVYGIVSVSHSNMNTIPLMNCLQQKHTQMLTVHVRRPFDNKLIYRSHL